MALTVKLLPNLMGWGHLSSMLLHTSWSRVLWRHSAIVKMRTIDTVSMAAASCAAWLMHTTVTPAAQHSLASCCKVQGFIVLFAWIEAVTGM